MQTNRLIIDSVKETDKLDYFLNISHDKKVLETFICRYAETVDDLDFAPYLSNDKLFAIRLKETGKLIGIILYFDEKEGIGYNYGRVHINSCDFSLGNYACVEENDETLETFNIERDKKSLIPMIKDAQKYGDIDMLASPWSPPAYMKTNGQMNYGGTLKEEYRDKWAECYVKFIELYKKLEDKDKTGSIRVMYEMLTEGQ